MLKLGHNCGKASTNCSSGSAMVMFSCTVGLWVLNTSRKLNLHLHSWELMFWRQKVGDNCAGAMNDPYPGWQEVSCRWEKLRRQVDEIRFLWVSKRCPGCSDRLNADCPQETAQLSCWEFPRCLRQGWGCSTQCYGCNSLFRPWKWWSKDTEQHRQREQGPSRADSMGHTASLSGFWIVTAAEE